MFGDNKAVTPVMSNLLLTVIAVAAMAIATTATYVITGNLHDTMGERLIIEDVWFKQNNETAIYFRNVGKITIKIITVYINYTSQPFTPFELKIGEHEWLNLTYSWSSDSIYHFYVMTDRGAKVEEFYRAP